MPGIPVAYLILVQPHLVLRLLKVQVLEYDDHAEAKMPEDDKPMRLTKLTLRPRIVVGSGVKEERILKLTEMAHKQCYISNSLSTEIVVEPTVEIREWETAD